MGILRASTGMNSMETTMCLFPRVHSPPAPRACTARVLPPSATPGCRLLRSCSPLGADRAMGSRS
eukprot:2163018-Rhodomonas_salina.1